MTEEIYDDKGKLIHYKDTNGFESWIEFDENNNRIHYKNNEGFEHFYKYINKEKIEITKAEFEQIKRDKVINNYFKNNKVSRFELMDL